MFVASELMERSYGGGVLAFEPGKLRDPNFFKRSFCFDFKMQILWRGKEKSSS